MATKITATKAELAARVANFQKIDVKHGASILSLAAASMIYASDCGGDKAALKEMRSVISGVSDEYARQVSAWVGGNLDRYAAYLSGSHDATPADRTAGLVAAMQGEGEAKRGWRKIRSEHIVPKAKKADKAKAESDATNGSTEAEAVAVPTDGELLASAIKAVRAMSSMADLNSLSGVVLAQLRKIAKANKAAEVVVAAEPVAAAA